MSLLIQAISLPINSLVKVILQECQAGGTEASPLAEGGGGGATMNILLSQFEDQEMGDRGRREGKSSSSTGEKEKEAASAQESLKILESVNIHNFDEGGGSIHDESLIAWLKDDEAPNSLACLLILLKLICHLKVRVAMDLVESVPLVSTSKEVWMTRRDSPFSTGLYSLEITPRTLLTFFSSSFPFSSSSSNSFSTSSTLFTFKDIVLRHLSPRSIKLKIEKNVKSLSKLNKIQANCLGLLARSKANTSPEPFFRPSTSLLDVSSSYLLSMRRPLEELILEEISVLEEVCNSLADLQLPVMTRKEHETGEDELLNDGARTFVQKSALKLEKINSKLSLLNLGKVIKQFEQPSFLERNWYLISGTLISILWVHRSITFPTLLKILKNSLFDLADTIKSSFQQWIINPCLDILKTIRHKEPRLAIMGSKSLASDLESLERMVVSFARDHAPNVDIDLITSQVKTGDLSAVLTEYESDIKHPVSSIVTGSLVRSLLIQLQKAKVDGALAMSALDKLLQSNELNFAFLAFIPTLLISYSLLNYLKGWVGSGERMRRSQLSKEVMAILRDIERLLLRSEKENGTRRKDEVIGYLLCHLVHLDKVVHSASSIGRQHQRLLLQDIRDLESALLEDSSNEVLNLIIQRIYRFL